MAIGPSEGNGYIWQRGPYLLGIWNESDQDGFGEPFVIGHKDGTTWVITGTLQQEDPGGWQNIINIREKGLIGAYYVKDMIPKINALLPILYPLNPKAGIPVKNTDPYSKDTWNALLAQFTDTTPDGLLKQRGA